MKLVPQKMGKKLDSDRKVMGITYKQLAKQTGLSFETVYHFLKGDVKNPTIKTVIRLAHFFGYKITLERP